MELRHHDAPPQHDTHVQVPRAVDGLACPVAVHHCVDIRIPLHRPPWTRHPGCACILPPAPRPRPVRACSFRCRWSLPSCWRPPTLPPLAPLPSAPLSCAMLFFARRRQHQLEPPPPISRRPFLSRSLFEKGYSGGQRGKGGGLGGAGRGGGASWEGDSDQAT
eukprot:3941420-Rhodomonas_salina.3